MDAAHRAVAWMLLASVAFGSGSALVKWTAGQAGVATVIFGRSLVITLILLTWSQLRGASLYVGNRRRMLWRSTVGLSAMACYFYAVQQIPLSNAVTLQYTAPLFVALFSGAMLRERVSPLVYGCIALSFVGTVSIVSPSLRSVDIDALVALISGVLSAFAYLAVRGLRTSASPDGVVFWFALFCTLVTLPLAASELPQLALSEIARNYRRWHLRCCGTDRDDARLSGGACRLYRCFLLRDGVSGGIYGWLLFHQTLVWGDALGAALIVGSGALLVSSAPNAKPSGEQLP